MTGHEKPTFAFERDYLDLAVGDEAIFDRPGDVSAWEIPAEVTLERDTLVFRRATV
jgi:hypothetical protein